MRPGLCRAGAGLAWCAGRHRRAAAQAPRVIAWTDIARGGRHRRRQRARDARPALRTGRAAPTALPGHPALGFAALRGAGTGARRDRAHQRSGQRPQRPRPRRGIALFHRRRAGTGAGARVQTPQAAKPAELVVVVSPGRCRGSSAASWPMCCRASTRSRRCAT